MLSTSNVLSRRLKQVPLCRKPARRAGRDAQIWLTLQSKWDLWHAMKARGRQPKVRQRLLPLLYVDDFGDD